MSMRHQSRAEQIKGQLGCLERSFNITLDASDTFHKVHMLVNGTGQEMTYKLALDFMALPKVKKMIQLGYLKVFTLMSGKILESGETIPGATINGQTPISQETFDELTGTQARKEVWRQIYDAADKHENFVIFHVQMLGVGMDLPCLNSIVLMGDKNETDLFQTIMRGCRVDHNNPKKESYHVFIYVPDAVQTYMKNFIEVLDKKGGPELIAAFSNDVQQGSSTGKYEAIFSSLLSGTASFNSVEEAYSEVINCNQYQTKSALIKALRDKMLQKQAEGKTEEYELLRQKWFSLMNDLSV